MQRLFKSRDVAVKEKQRTEIEWEAMCYELLTKLHPTLKDFPTEHKPEVDSYFDRYIINFDRSLPRIKRLQQLHEALQAQLKRDEKVKQKQQEQKEGKAAQEQPTPARRGRGFNPCCGSAQD